MSRKFRCCIPYCHENEDTLDHVAYYGVKSSWRHQVVKFLQSVQTHVPHKGVIKLASGVICAKHYQQCGIKSNTLQNNIYYPHLRISVCPQPRLNKRKYVGDKSVDFAPVLKKIRNVGLATYSETVLNCEDIGVGLIGREETFPPLKSEEVCEIRPKKLTVLKPKIAEELEDHNYALNLNSIQALKNDFETFYREKLMVERQLDKKIAEQQKEITRLKANNHELMKTNLEHLYSKVEYPFRNIAHNEQMLKSYTGFSTSHSFIQFLDLVKPKYLTAIQNLQSRKSPLTMNDQLVLVLAKLRLNLTHHDLAYRFNTSVTTILKIWTFWIQLLGDLLSEESQKISRKGADVSNKFILECCDTLFEIGGNPDPARKKMYGRAKAMIEVSRNGFVINVSNLFAPRTLDKEIIEKCNFKTGLSEGKNRIGKFSAFQIHIQRILCFIKGFRILKGVFPSAVCNYVQLNSYWKICCFLVNYINQNQPLDEEIKIS